VIDKIKTRNFVIYQATTEATQVAQSFEKNFFTEKSSYNLLSEEEHSKSKPM
jgi:hypothetical protein